VLHRIPATRYDRLDMIPRNVGAVASGGVLLTWPALANGYPLLFSDTGSFMEQLLLPFMIWDKPWIYGPALVIVSLEWTLWLPVLAQSLLMSWVLWRVQGVFRAPSAAWHLGVALVLAAGSAAPWFAALLMPDILAPLTVLLLFLLAFDPDRRFRIPLIALASFAITSHLSHLLIAGACLVVVPALRPRAFATAAAPLAVSIMLLMATNLAGHGRLGISPYGAVFGLARLVADGPARLYLEEACPDAGYRMCDWAGRFPSDADAFLWDPAGPVWTFPGGPIALAPEAADIVAATIRSRPLSVARDAVHDFLSQLVTLSLDDIVAGKGLDATVGVQLRAHYSPAEQHRFDASAQRSDRLAAVAAPWRNVHIAMLALGSIGCAMLLIRSWRNDRVLFALTALIVVGLLGNAFATGVLSGPHGRYQARIAWLVLLPPMMFAARDVRGEASRRAAA
jgi:hypothetical protein